MAIPSEPVLRGAQRWLSLLGSAGLPRSRNLLTGARDYADLTPSQYEESLSWLRASGMVDATSRPTRPDISGEELFVAAVLADPPVWLNDADVLVRETIELPADVVQLAECLEIEDTSAVRLVRRAWAKVDLEARRRVGDAGERTLLDLFDACTNATVDHVASWSDSHGYDLSVTAPGLNMHLEVKATTRLNRLVIFLSRNEFETMLSDPDWQLVIVELTQELDLLHLASVNTSWLVDSAPKDRGPLSQWESARFEIPRDATTVGIPRVKPIVDDPLSRLLVG